MTDVTEILIHWYAGRSQSEVATSLGVDRKTIKKYVTPAIEAGIVPGGPAMSVADWAELTGKWFPAVADTRLRQTTWPQIETHRDYIADMLKAGVTQATIWQRLRDEQHLLASLASLKRWVAANLPEEVRRDRVTVLMDEPQPGGEAQIDYGHLGAWVDPRTGRKRRVWAFVMVLAHSRHLFVLPVVTMPVEVWVEAHVAALNFFGGAPRRLVTDNLKAGVIKPDLYDPKLNRTYAELAQHYGMLIDPARARKPKDKPRVERPIPHVRDSFFAGRDFASLQAMREAAATSALLRRRALGGFGRSAVRSPTELPTSAPTLLSASATPVGVRPASAAVCSTAPQWWSALSHEADDCHVELSQAAGERVASGRGVEKTERARIIGEVARGSQHVVRLRQAA